ncbi:MAG: S8 family serine peptidase [Saprospiraceae bacterium]|nr:S8 family serine peptidase [Saprospiraceae bacterium]MBK9631279.1 S8 family serine peptidase [Saprospiraceae bacterium]
MKFVIHIFAFLIFVFNVENTFAQASVPKNWFNLDPQADGFNGVSSDKAHKELLTGRVSKQVIVAILDSGVEVDHDDLKSVMWINPGEIANNGIDDDKNGYIDDIHGWNFIGGANGNVGADTYETTRLYAQMRYKYDNADPDKLNKTQKKEFIEYLKLKNDVESRRTSAKGNLDAIMATQNQVMAGIDAVVEALGKKPLTMENLDMIEENDSKKLSMGVAIAKNIITQDPDLKTGADLKSFITKEYSDGIDHFTKELEYNFNPDFDSRKIVGDQYSNVDEKYYGNNDFEGPEASHGTHVAGCVAAARGNGVGMDGVATNVRIMSVRCVPDGDERDKDVANAIRYAVDNGASVINMSFGKGHSPQKDAVDAAVKYAASKDVLIVHAAGNGSADIDKVDNFPNKYYKKKKFLSSNKAKNWLEIGALSHEKGSGMIAGFSNYGKKNVDFFSPGMLIYSTVPDNGYQNLQGTSMAAPIAAGVAAMIRSHFPTLTAEQVADVMRKSVVKSDIAVKVPGKEGGSKKLSELCSTGGYVNAYQAVMLASKTKGKKKVKGWSDPGPIVPGDGTPRT